MMTKGLYCFYLYDGLSRIVAEGTCASCDSSGTVAHATFSKIRLRSAAFKDTMGWSNPGGPLKPITDAYEDSTDYMGNFVFENGKPDKYLFSGGYYSYAKNSIHLGVARREAFHYYITDHLGNNCVVVSDNDSIEQVTHYYPFGAVYADAGLSPGFQKYKYTGKELDLTHGLKTYDHGARQNYSILGVWDRIDPMYEKYYNVSPYVVCRDNPIKNIDKNGKWDNPFSALLYWTITSNSQVQYDKDAISNNYKWTINVFSQDEYGDFVITNHHFFDEELKKNASETLDDYSRTLSEFSTAISSIGDGAEKGALISFYYASEVAFAAATIGVTANKIGTITDFNAKMLNLYSSILKENVDEKVIEDLIFSGSTMIMTNVFQTKMKPMIKELFPDMSKRVEDAIYDQMQKIMENGRN